MPLFLHSRLVTWLSVLLVAACASLSTFYYSWTCSRAWPSPTNVTKVFAALFALQSLLTCHSLRQSSKSLSFGLWSIFGIASIVFDCWWFALMVSRGGFEAVCGRHGREVG
ncbi:hypothetical protein JCM10213v2_004207 [Rhodosporidiobolus nylandii]